MKTVLTQALSPTAAALALVAPILGQSTEGAAPPTRPPVEIVILGTYHFANPGLDEHNIIVDDYFAEKRQAELQQVVDHLVEFAPTTICVEARAGQQATIDTRYAAFRDGELALTDLSYGRSEVYQLGFRAAAALGHDRVVCVDAPGRWLGAAVREAAAEDGVAEYADHREASSRRTAEEEKTFASQTVLENLIDLNRKASLRENHAFYNEICPLIQGSDDVGAELVGEWYKRNARIYGNIVRSVRESDERLLVIVGQGHVPILLQFFEAHTGFEVVRALQILDRERWQPLSPAMLAPYTSHFDVRDGRLVAAGDAAKNGAALLREEIAASQFVLLGEYHGSTRISELTQAIVAVMHDDGCRHLGLEIGPVSAEILADLARGQGSSVDALRQFHDTYGQRTRTSRWTAAIPFFANLEDAAFLDEAIEREWRVVGLDQEFIYGYQPLLERMQDHLEPARAAALVEPYRAATSALAACYASQRAQDGDFAALVHDNEPIAAYLTAAAEGHAENARVAAAIRATTRIYRDNGLRRYYECNSGRIQHMKDNLREACARTGLDLTTDRLLLKMGGVHTGRGLSPLSLFEIGNTLSEVAELNGRRSLHVQFASRFGRDGDDTYDRLAEGAREAPFLAMAKADQWTMIDLRPLRDELEYYGRIDLDDDYLRGWFHRFDLIVIPKTEVEPTPNHSQR
ncbi:MAG: DUF5694 domain-containing protein [Planctomycetota bacterium]